MKDIFAYVVILLSVVAIAIFVRNVTKHSLEYAMKPENAGNLLFLFILIGGVILAQVFFNK